MFLHDSVKYPSAEYCHSSRIAYLVTARTSLRYYKRARNVRHSASAVDTSLSVHPSAANVIRYSLDTPSNKRNDVNAIQANRSDEPSSDLRDMCNLILRQLAEATSGQGFREVRVYIRSSSSMGSDTAKLVLISSLSPGPGASFETAVFSPAAVAGDDVVVLHMGEVRNNSLQANQSAALYGSQQTPTTTQLPEASALSLARKQYSMYPIPGTSAPPIPGTSAPEENERSLVRWNSSRGGSGALWPKEGLEMGAFSTRMWRERGDGLESSSVPEVLVLPNSGTMVVPLLEGTALVGLLVMDPSSGHGDNPESAPFITSKPQPLMLEESEAQACLFGSDDPSLSASCSRTTSPSLLRPLSVAVPMLSKACVMDIKRSLQSARLGTEAAEASRVLRDVRRGASVLSTMSAMLVPRLPEGAPERDLATGISLQGKRIQDLVRQLDTALSKQRADPSMILPTDTSSSSALQPVEASRQLQQAEPVLPSFPVTVSSGATTPPPITSGAPHPGSSSGYSAQLPSMQIPQKLLRSPSVTLQGGQQKQEVMIQPSSSKLLAAESSHFAAASEVQQSAPSSAGVVITAECSPSVAPLIVDQHEGGPVEYEMRLGSQEGSESVEMMCTSSPLSSGTRWQKPLRPQSQTRAPDPFIKSSDQSSGTQRESLSPTGRTRVASKDIAMPPSSGAPDKVRGVGSSTMHSTAFYTASASSCDVVEVLRGLLTAALKLAGLGGVHMIVQPPLSVEVMPPTVSASSQEAPLANFHHDSKNKSGHTEIRGSEAQMGGLRPRPTRPLRAEVPSMVLRRIMSYLVDIALQCTPQGGQLCVSAQLTEGSRPMEQGSISCTTLQVRSGTAEDDVRMPLMMSQDVVGPWIQLLIVHTGCLVMDRMHVASSDLPTARWKQQQQRNKVALSKRAHQQVLVHNHPATSSGPTRNQLPTPVAAADSSNRRPGLLSFGMAKELVLGAGGKVNVSNPVPMVNARSGQVDSATCIEIMLPAAYLE
ncbi:hypothetical protein CEUSTIGMA_g4451.t1 [Chlamydomonas eustigma]|uniref:Uncharacterized protein n=1 Tax=Chlamydomonas eustigma TaxID=1157962 RepID=A0A250X1N0_9CHLO|nr:hypothetical protein CEUSTIGMA_g4451.t1 [Chlamydomonas eustigma]|eukprot:GAX77004.1 hypothetical protein CEUSTIGMA_g4451.t1 [Chlamydomonas eustigma]